MSKIDIRGPIRIGGEEWPREYSAPDFHPMTKFFVAKMTELDPQSEVGLVFGYGLREDSREDMLTHRHIGFYASKEDMIAIAHKIIQDLGGRNID